MGGYGARPSGVPEAWLWNAVGPEGYEYGETECFGVGLDATNAGLPLYKQKGFRQVAPIVRWSGSLDPSSFDAGKTELIGPGLAMRLYRFDRKFAGVDRGLLIKRLIREEKGAAFTTAHKNEDLAGYVLLRPGRTAWQAGPHLTESENGAKHLLNAAAEFLDGRKVLLDAVEGFGFSAMLEEVGLKPTRRLTRMTVPRPRRLLTGPSIVAAAGFEWG